MRETNGLVRSGAQGTANSTVQPSHHDQPFYIEYGEQGGEQEDGQEIQTEILNRYYKSLSEKDEARAGDNQLDLDVRQRMLEHQWLQQTQGVGNEHTQSLGGRHLLETHFDSTFQKEADFPTSYHARSSSFSTADNVNTNSLSTNLNQSFPGCDTTSSISSSVPYISSSVTLPVLSQRPDGGENSNGNFYQNVSGKIRQPSLRYKEEQRASFARQQQELLHKSPRTQELEEFAAKFEGYQVQRNRRLAVQPTPMLDQLAREQLWPDSYQSNHPLWQGAEAYHQNQQLSALETNLLRLVQRNDSVSGRGIGSGSGRSDGDASSGRESVTTVISNSSSDTLRFNERHSSNETLKYQDTCPDGGGYSEHSSPDAAEDRIFYSLGNFPNQEFMAVRDRTRSYCDENYAVKSDRGQWQTKFHQETDEKSLLAQEVDRNSMETKTPLNISQTLGNNQTNKKMLFRSYSESGSTKGDRPQNIRNDGMAEGVVSSTDKTTTSEQAISYEKAEKANIDILTQILNDSSQSSSDHESQKKVSYSETKNENGDNKSKEGGATILQSSRVPIRSSRVQVDGGQQKVTALQALFAGTNANVDTGNGKSDQQRVEGLEKNTFPRMRGGMRTRKPKLPTPPCSPKIGGVDDRLKKFQQDESRNKSLPMTGGNSGHRNCTTPSPPPPPPPDTCDHLAINGPLPPPPIESLANIKHSERGEQSSRMMEKANQQTPTSLPIPNSQNKPPANTPKRDSPATIAAKEAPGWQMFLGMKSSTVSFTSAEATKFRAARDESRSRGGGRRDDSRSRKSQNNSRQNSEREEYIVNPTRDQENGNTRVNDIQQGQKDILSDQARANLFKIEAKHNLHAKHFHKNESNPEKRPKTRREEYRVGRIRKGEVDRCDEVGVNASSVKEDVNYQRKFKGSKESIEQGTPSDRRSIASPDEKQHTLHLSRERSLKSISNWWKSSLEGGPTPPQDRQGDTWADNDEQSTPVRHNHSHSDSGISSMSGRSSCMSPMSDLSSSSGSSRTSLRSSSIVSANNILIEEEEQRGEMDYKDLCKELLSLAPPDSRISSIIRSSLTLSLQVYFRENSLEFEIVSNFKEQGDIEGPLIKRSTSSNFDESRKKLLKIASSQIESQRRHQQLLKESSKANDDVGKEILTELARSVGVVGKQQPEVDKVKLFIEEVDKITSLIIGLSSRLAKASLSCSLEDSEEKLQAAEVRRGKLAEQLDEARKLRQSIFRRGDAVFTILSKYVDPRSVEAFGAFTKEKIRLILETRQHTEVLKSEEEILKCLKEYSSNGEMII